MTSSQSEEGSQEETLLKIFLAELQSQVQTLRKGIESLTSESQDLTDVDVWIKTVQSIAQAAKIVQLDAFNEMSQALENYLKALQEGKFEWNTQGQSVLNQALDFFSELSLVAPDQVPLFMQEQVTLLQKLVQHFHELVKQQEISVKKVIEKQSLPVASPPSQEVFIDKSMFDLFCIELETQCQTLNQGLVEIEQNPHDQENFLESLMRAAHSIKGAARVVNLSPIVRLAHAMEDYFVAAQQHKIEIQTEQIDQLLRGVDFLGRLLKVNLTEMNRWLLEQHPVIESLIQEIASTSTKPSSPIFKKNVKKLTQPEAPLLPAPLAMNLIGKEGAKKVETMKAFQASFAQDRVLRITAQNLTQLMGLAGESLVESRWLYPFEESLQTFKNNLKQLSGTLDLLRDNFSEHTLNERAQRCLTDLHEQFNTIRQHLSERLGELDHFIRRHATLSDRLYQEVINSRMRPFADGVEGFPRMVRDLARELGKRVKLEIKGKSTPVDRDILEKLESPLSHLLRNAVDHGIELPEERQKANKPLEGIIKLEARHRGGVLAITVSDDGRGIDIDQLRRNIVERNLVSAEMASRLTDAEIADFLFLPGFSTALNLTEISGRGIGLNIVQNVVQEVGGIVRTLSTPGKGVSFHLQLPLTLSVIRTLIVEISGEPYAFPLARIEQALLIKREEIEILEHRQFFHYEGQNIGLLSAWQVLGLPESQVALQQLSVIVLSDRLNHYGLVVDRLLGEKELVVQELDGRLGKIPDISAGALMEDGSPVLIIDIEDIVRSIDHLLSGGRLTKVLYANKEKMVSSIKRVLVVDDSLTVREVECRLLQNQGYEVETAVNGMDGWNAVRMGHYDLVITDIDMPRMNGIELLRAIKNDPKLRDLPVMIVSYKEGEEDRLKGLEAGADYYLTKSSFHDATLIDAVHDLIGNSLSSKKNE